MASYFENGYKTDLVRGHIFVVSIFVGFVVAVFDLVQNAEAIIQSFITKTRPCNEHPLTPHFYIGLHGYTFFLIFAPKHRLLVLVITASLRRF